MATRVKRAFDFSVGDSRVPHEVRWLRESSLEAHRTVGQAIVHKHRWNEQDLENGLATRCPLHDDVYLQDRQWDDTCFGTGYVGAFDDGEVTYAVLEDSREDVITWNQQGQLVHERHPQMLAPWEPVMGDGDLIIVVDFQPTTMLVLRTGDRYLLEQVTPATARGPGFSNINRSLSRLVTHQSAVLDLLPPNHEFSQVPINFDYSKVNLRPTPLDVDPDDPTFGKYMWQEFSVRIEGDEALFRNSHSQDVMVSVVPPTTSPEYDVRIHGRGHGAHVEL